MTNAWDIEAAAVLQIAPPPAIDATKWWPTDIQKQNHTFLTKPTT